MLLEWGQVDLAREAFVGVATLRRIETIPGVISDQTASFKKIVAALEAVGIEFLGSSERDHGVRLISKED